jgi:hypothetical protein
MTTAPRRRGSGARAHALGQRDIAFNDLKLLKLRCPSTSSKLTKTGQLGSGNEPPSTEHAALIVDASVWLTTATAAERVASCERAHRNGEHDIEPDIRQRSSAMTAAVASYRRALSSSHNS